MATTRNKIVFIITKLFFMKDPDIFYGRLSRFSAELIIRHRAAAIMGMKERIVLYSAAITDYLSLILFDNREWIRAWKYRCGSVKW
jgi:hypothetical protein